MSWYTKSSILQKVLPFCCITDSDTTGPKKKKIIARSGHDRKYLKLEINFHPKF